MLVEECAPPNSLVVCESARMRLIICKALLGCSSVVGCDFAHSMLAETICSCAAPSLGRAWLGMVLLLLEHSPRCRSVNSCELSCALHFVRALFEMPFRPRS